MSHSRAPNLLQEVAVDLSAITRHNTNKLCYWHYCSFEEMEKDCADPYKVFITDRAAMYGYNHWPEKEMRKAAEVAQFTYRKAHMMLIYSDNSVYGIGYDSTVRSIAVFDHPLHHTPECAPQSLVRKIFDRKPLYSIENAFRYLQNQFNANTFWIITNSDQYHMGGQMWAKLQANMVTTKNVGAVQIMDTITYLLMKGKIHVVHHLCDILAYTEIWWQNAMAVKTPTQQLTYWSLAIRDKPEAEYTFSFVSHAVRIILYACRINTDAEAAELIEFLQHNRTYQTIDETRRQTLEHYIGNRNFNRVLAHPCRGNGNPPPIPLPAVIPVPPPLPQQPRIPFPRNRIVVGAEAVQLVPISCVEMCREGHPLKPQCAHSCGMMASGSSGQSSTMEVPIELGTDIALNLTHRESRKNRDQIIPK